MKLIVEERLSDSPLVERIWRARNDESIHSFTSIAVNQCDLVIWKQNGQTYVNLQGPETKASTAPVPQNAEFFGIIFKTGTMLPHLPVSELVNGNISLPAASSNAFWLKGAAREIPTYENADTFIERLTREGLLYHEPLVEDVLRGYQPNMSLRSIQRRFRQTVGLTHSAIHQIERARRATILLQQGVSILDTVHLLGYFDQPHLTHALRNFIGQTPTQLQDIRSVEQLSYLYKTALFDQAMMLTLELNARGA